MRLFKKVLLVFVSVVCSFSAIGQWQGDGDGDIYGSLYRAGRVGIGNGFNNGISDVNYRLHVQDDDGGGNSIQAMFEPASNAGQNGIIAVRGARDKCPQCNTAQIQFQNHDQDYGSNEDYQMGMIAGGKGNPDARNGNLRFFTRSASNGLDEHVRIDTVGNVGIGTSSPGYKLHVNGNTRVNNDHYVGGKLGIGTTSPSKKMHISGTSPNIKITNTSSNGLGTYGINFDGYFTLKVTKEPMAGHYDNGLFIKHSGNKLISIEEDGNVGIGIASEEDGNGYHLGHKLEVDGNAKIHNNLYVMNTSGIGTTSPSYKLHVAGNSKVNNNQYIGGKLGIGTESPQNKLHLNGGIARITGSQSASTISGNALRMGSNGSNYNWMQSSGAPLVINPFDDGNTNQYVAIGFKPSDSDIDDPSDYNLAVDGKVICEELKIQFSEHWADHVFEEGYDLRSVAALETYINENGHLPKMPSAAEVQEAGYNAGEMDRNLLKTVEEQSLYIIRQHKKLDSVQQVVKKQRQRLQKQQEQMEALARRVKALEQQ